MKKGFTSVAEQVAQVIRDGLQEERWVKTVPGRNRLAKELGVNHKTAQAALNQLESEGLLKSQGPGRERLIVDHGRATSKVLRVMILTYEKSDCTSADLLNITHRLQAAGHVTSFASKTLADLGMDVKRVARFAKQTDTDAWLIVAGSRNILNWFAEQAIPVFALYGRAIKVSIANTGPEKSDAFKELIDRLFEWGHRRIVYLTREERRKPVMGAFERLYLGHLEELGITTGLFNLPDWGNNPDDLRQGLESLFRSTPPTAIIVDDSNTFLAVVQHLARMGISAPEKISLACTDFSPSFDWCRPKVTHIAWNSSVAARRVVNWMSHVSQGKNDRRKTLMKAKLLMGGTTGPAPMREGTNEAI